MIQFDQALESANLHFKEKNNTFVAKALDCGSAWVFYGSCAGERELGATGWKIDKETGKSSAFILPTPENLALLKDAKPVLF